jgi:hypothetical protein
MPGRPEETRRTVFKKGKADAKKLYALADSDDGTAGLGGPGLVQ